MSICPIPEGSLTWFTDPSPVPPPGVTTARAGLASTLGTASQEQEGVPGISGPGGHKHRLYHLPRLPVGLQTPQINLLLLKTAPFPRDTPSSPPSTKTHPLPKRAQLSPERQ